jgi:hypothetical protein
MMRHALPLLVQGIMGGTEESPGEWPCQRVAQPMGLNVPTRFMLNNGVSPVATALLEGWWAPLEESLQENGRGGALCIAAAALSRVLAERFQDRENLAPEADPGTWVSVVLKLQEFLSAQPEEGVWRVPTLDFIANSGGQGLTSAQALLIVHAILFLCSRAVDLGIANVPGHDPPPGRSARTVLLLALQWAATGKTIPAEAPGRTRRQETLTLNAEEAAVALTGPAWVWRAGSSKLWSLQLGLVCGLVPPLQVTPGFVFEARLYRKMAWVCIQQAEQLLPGEPAESGEYPPWRAGRLKLHDGTWWVDDGDVQQHREDVTWEQFMQLWQAWVFVGRGMLPPCLHTTGETLRVRLERLAGRPCGHQAAEYFSHLVGSLCFTQTNGLGRVMQGTPSYEGTSVSGFVSQELTLWQGKAQELMQLAEAADAQQRCSQYELRWRQQQSELHTLEARARLDAMAPQGAGFRHPRAAARVEATAALAIHMLEWEQQGVWLTRDP